MAATDCIFCKIAAGTIPAKKLAENDKAFVIADISPQARKHYLVITKQHIRSLETAFESESIGRAIVGDLFTLGMEFAKKEGGLLPAGFRSVINTNDDGGQTVDHIHLHLVGGEKLKGHFA